MEQDYVSLSLAQKLNEKKFDWCVASMYGEIYTVKDEIRQAYPGMSDCGYEDLLIKNGGPLKEDEVYTYYKRPLEISCSNTDFYFKHYPYMICSRPTLYDAQKWLRVKHLIHISVDFNEHGWYYKIYDIKEDERISSSDGYVGTFEQALGNAIEDASTFIKIKKKN